MALIIDYLKLIVGLLNTNSLNQKLQINGYQIYIFALTIHLSSRNKSF